MSKHRREETVEFCVGRDGGARSADTGSGQVATRAPGRPAPVPAARRRRFCARAGQFPGLRRWPALLAADVFTRRRRL